MSGALTCEDVSKAFRGGAVVLDGVDLDVPAGKALVLLGTSGAGKTTLLRVIAGLEKADAGRVTLNGTTLSDPVVRVPPEQRSVGMVFQALELWAHMSVAEHIAFGLPGRPRGRAALTNEIVIDIAAEVGLDAGLLGRKPTTLSGGEQQRVAIARTLAAQPAVILYDEPLANLDPGRRRALRALIRRLAAEHGTTLVYVTHDPEEALEIGDDLAVMAAGRVVERGPPQDVYRAPRTLLGAHALGPVTTLPGTWREGRVETPLGTLDAVPGATAQDGEVCLALVRPEGIGPVTDAGAEVLITDVVARGTDWAFSATLGGRALYGRSSQRLEAGALVRVAARGPAAVVADADVGEVVR